jgi:excinuclease ABC subunit B
MTVCYHFFDKLPFLPMAFKLVSEYKPAGDQPSAIESLFSGFKKKDARLTLLGVTGSGKTFTMANVIEKTQLPTLVIAHNKTLAAQLCNEFRSFFPGSSVEYFVSYYDYYQPEAYMPGSDTYIEKEAQINAEIDRLRHAATQAVLSRKDVIIVASVSAIYSLGSPSSYENVVLHLREGDPVDRRAMLEKLIQIQFTRTNADLTRGSFRMRGSTIDVMPASEEMVYRFEIGSRIQRIEKIHPVSRKILTTLKDAWIFPTKHYIASDAQNKSAIKTISKELEERLVYFKKHEKHLEYERLRRRVRYDLEMIKNVGYCNGIENYSLHFDGRAQGEAPYTLFDFFAHGSGDFLTIIDESHVTIPQIRAMFRGDRARKNTLVEHGFRLPSARDNRPLTFEEFDERVQRLLYVSATPAEYELKDASLTVEQIVRPTGLVDPQIQILPVTENPETGTPSQIDDVIARIRERTEKKQRSLVTTLTKKMAEDLTTYLEKQHILVQYLHSDIKTIDRIDIISKLRQGTIDVIVGVNLLREGLDIPEVAFVAILDADKEGFLRSQTSLIQTIGRAARNVDGEVVMYADDITGSIERAVAETQRRRRTQLEYNKKHNITPTSIRKEIRNILEEFGIEATTDAQTEGMRGRHAKAAAIELAADTRPTNVIIKEKEKLMRKAAKNLEFELAAILRDEVKLLKKRTS